MKSVKEILDETVEYYGTHPRAINRLGECAYHTEDGKECAVGRCMLNLIALQLGDRQINVNEIPEYTGKHTLDDVLKEEYKGHSIEFWHSLQSLHDARFYWSDDKKLTKRGVIKYNNILETFSK